MSSRKTISHSDLPITTPFQCPICQPGKVIIESIDEWDETVTVTDSGINISCSLQPDDDSDDWDEWLNGHFNMPYVDWLPLQQPVTEWFNARFWYVSEYERSLEIRRYEYWMEHGSLAGFRI